MDPTHSQYSSYSLMGAKSAAAEMNAKTQNKTSDDQSKDLTYTNNPTGAACAAAVRTQEVAAHVLPAPATKSTSAYNPIDPSIHSHVPALQYPTKEKKIEAIQAAMAKRDFPAFMNILMQMKRDEMTSVKESVMKFIIENRKELVKFVTVRDLNAQDRTGGLRCAFHPCAEGHGKPFYEIRTTVTNKPSPLAPKSQTAKLITLKYEHRIAENVAVYELGDGHSRKGYAIVSKNRSAPLVSKTENWAENLKNYGAQSAQQDTNTFRVEYIEVDEAHQNKGVAYLLLYRILSDKLAGNSDKPAHVVLLDQSFGKGLKLYQNVAGDDFERRYNKWSNEYSYHKK